MNTEPNLTPEDLALIERYLLRQLGMEELAAFEERQLTDAPFKLEVLQMKQLYNGINEAALMERMAAYHRSLPRQQQPKRHRIPIGKWLAAAAVLLLLLGAGWWLLGNNKNDRLYAKYYKPDPGLITAMGASDNYAFDRAMVDYKTGNHEAAISAWSSQLKTKPDNDTLNYFIGVAMMGSGSATKANAYLQKVAGNSNSYFVKEAHWYLGLALLKEGRAKEAGLMIEQSNHPDKQRILAELNTK